MGDRQFLWEDEEFEIGSIDNSNTSSYLEQIKLADDAVISVLGHQRNNVLVIKDLATFNNYVDKAILSGAIAIDTETNNSLDPKTCKLMGLCLYSPNQKQAYVPINHRNPETKERLTWQITEPDLAAGLIKIVNSKIEIIMHNGKFDYEVLKCTCGVEVSPTWDTIIGALILNENERGKMAGLKWQYTHKIDKNQKEYGLEKLYNGVFYADDNPEIFALYAATDALMTYRLYNEYQRKQFELPDNRRLFELFKNIEMPIVKITAEIELSGVNVDVNFGLRLKEKYLNELNDIDKKIDDLLNKLAPIILKWRETKEAKDPIIIYAPTNTSKTPEEIEKLYPFLDESNWRHYKKGSSKISSLKDPINMNSPTQLAILFYDVFLLPSPSKFNPRSTETPALKSISSMLAEMINEDREVEDGYEDDFDTDEDLEEFDTYLNQIEEEIGDTNKTQVPEYYADVTTDDFENLKEICDLLIKRRGLVKIISSYLETIPSLATAWPDGRIRFHLNSLGTVTGRYSSGGSIVFNNNDKTLKISGINSQNIPSEVHQIRMQFKTKPGFSFVGGDFSQQEPLVAAHLSRDPNMVKCFVEGKDIYSYIAQFINENNYEDNLEYYLAGIELSEGDRKIITGEKTHINKDGKARRKQAKTVILAAMYGMGPYTAGIKMGKSKEEAEIILEDFFTKFSGVRDARDQSIATGERLGYVEDLIGRRRRLPNLQLPQYSAYYRNKPYINQNNPDELITDYINRLIEKGERALTKEERNFIIKEARNNNIVIKDNAQIIGKARRQSFNARIQGSAATITKAAMIAIANDPIMVELEAHMVIQVHDEVILECPTKNAPKVKEELEQIMMNCGYSLGITIPMKCDTVIETRWGEDAMSTDILDEYKEHTQKGGLTHGEALNNICLKYPEFPRESIESLINGTTDVLSFE